MSVYCEVVNEIRSAVLDADLPDDLIDDPNIRQYKTTKKAIVDIALYDESTNLLNDKSRKALQTYMLSLENRLLVRPEINSVNRRGYLKEEFQILLKPERLNYYNIPVDTVLTAIKENHIYRPAGSLDNRDRTRVTLIGKLDNRRAFEDLIIMAGFEGQKIRIRDIATVKKTFGKKRTYGR